MIQSFKMVNILGVTILLFFLSFKVYYVVSSFENKAYDNAIVKNSGDASHYLQIGRNIYVHKTFSDNNSTFPTQTATWRSPFWPLVLSIFYYITSSPFGLIVCKSLLELGLLIIALFYIRKYHKLNGLLFLPFLLILIEPQYIKYSLTFLSESLTAVIMLLLIIIYSLNDINKKSYSFVPILSAFVILCHPVSIFFVFCLFGFYVLFNIKHNFKKVALHTLIFILIVISWPIRNHVIFEEGPYMTISQGTTFSKGWNEKVASEFTNVDGDLADEYLNLKYLDEKDLDQLNTSEIVKSKSLKKATLKFIKQSSFRDRLEIILKKVRSNFYPFPEKLKPGFLEYLGSLFRVIYLLLFVQLLYRLFNKPSLNFNTIKGRIYLVVFSIFVGQILMSSFIYTGLRFNSIYGLSLLFCFLYLNIDLANNYLVKKQL